MTPGSLRRLAAVAALPALLAAGEFWSDKPFARWSAEETTRLLTDSPWAKSMTVTYEPGSERDRNTESWHDMGVPGRGLEMPGMGATFPGASPVGGLGAPGGANKMEVPITVVWASALPVRQAVALSRFGARELDSPEAREVVEKREEFYVLEIYGIPAIAAYRGTELLQREFYGTAVLETAKGRTLRPESAYVTPRGTNLLVTLRFPKSPALTEADKEVRFRATAKPFSIDRHFRLKAMAVGGKLEL